MTRDLVGRPYASCLSIRIVYRRAALRDEMTNFIRGNYVPRQIPLRSASWDSCSRGPLFIRRLAYYRGEAFPVCEGELHTETIQLLCSGDIRIHSSCITLQENVTLCFKQYNWLSGLEMEDKWLKFSTETGALFPILLSHLLAGKMECNLTTFSSDIFKSPALKKSLHHFLRKI